MASTPLRVLVANRGEIAARILRGIHTAGHVGLAVYSDADQDSPYLRFAAQAQHIGPAAAHESYLNIEKLLEAGRAMGANAVHPGYGFLSEKEEFAQAVENEGWIFIGPTAESISQMGDKTAAASIATKAGLPMVPSFHPEGECTEEELLKEAKKIGCPIMIKAAAGGGGKGMRIGHKEEEIASLMAAARREAKNAFNDERIFLEAYIEDGRHVEVQVLGDGKGKALAIGTRDCSIQRRHQKLIEECPAPFLEDKVRQKLEQSAANLVAQSNYRGAGTVEYLVVPSGDFYFLEMNTRLQVEHPVTEEVFGVDLLKQQLLIASEGHWDPELANPTPRGHAIEVRVYAENPEVGFLPATGLLSEVIWPSGPGVRVDSGVEKGNEISLNYDPLLAKIIVHGDSRQQACERLIQALDHSFIAGVENCLGFCRQILASEAFQKGDLCTNFLPQQFPDGPTPNADEAWIKAASYAASMLAGKSSGSGNSREATMDSAWQELRSWKMGPA